MTQAAIDARLSEGFRVLGNPIISLYNQRNFDVEWQPTLEPESIFRNNDGSYLAIFTQHQQLSNRGRTRAPVAHHAATLCDKLFTTFSPNADTPYPDAHLSTEQYFDRILGNDKHNFKPAYALLSGTTTRIHTRKPQRGFSQC